MVRTVHRVSEGDGFRDDIGKVLRIIVSSLIEDNKPKLLTSGSWTDRTETCYQGAIARRSGMGRRSA